MRLISFLLRSSWVTVAIASLAGAVSGAGSVLLIASINAAISTPGQQPSGVLVRFMSLALITLLAGSGSQILLARLSQQAIYKMRLQLSHWILSCPLRRLEDLGASRLLASLTDDIDAISATVFNLPLVLVNAALVIGCLGYLAWLSVSIFLITLVVIGFAIAVIQVMLNYVYALLKLARNQKDLLFKHFRSITDGVKELKLNC